MVMKSLDRREGPTKETDKRVFDFMKARFSEGVPVRRDDLQQL
jgi:hypothetical protein